MKITLFDELLQQTVEVNNIDIFDFQIEELPYDGAILHRLTLKLKPNQKARSLRVYWHKEHLIGNKVRTWNSDFFVAEHKLAEFFDAQFMEQYHAKHSLANSGRTWEGINFYRWRTIMQAAEFIPGQKSGWFLSMLPENPNGIMWYTYTKDEFILADSYRFIDQNTPVISEILEIPDIEDWRPPLGWFRNHFLEYFVPVNPKTKELSGTFCITNPLSSDATLDDAQKNGVCISELHNHYPMYGNFIPDMDKWKSVVLHDYPELPFPEDYISPQLINEFIDKMHKRNMKVLLYFQCTGDCFRPFALEHFPEDIAVDEDGNNIPAWRECFMMNALPGSKYAKHIDTMLERLFERHPNIDGIFMDQVCYPVEDIAHSDGKTGSKNKRISNVRESYYAAVEKVARMLHSRGKILWFNGSFDLKVQRFADGIMAEGLSGGSEKLRYFCLDKPLLVHQYPETVEKAVGIFSYALRAGATLISTGGSSRAVDAILSDDVAKIYKEGTKLLAPLQGRTWCYLPNPVEFPKGITGNIFYGKEAGSFIITVVSLDNLPPEAPAMSLSLPINLPGQFTAVCKTFGVDEYPVAIENNCLEIKTHSGLSTIILTAK
jgi:hypothetical protein